MSPTQTTSTLRAPEPSYGNENAIQLHRLSGSDNSVHALETNHPETGPTTGPQNHAEDHWDSKQGWPVVAAGSALFFVYLGLIYSYGIVQMHLAEARLASVPTLSFVGSVAAALAPLTGTVVARVIRKFGYRTTALAGSFMLGLGEFTAGWSTASVPAMFVTQGALFGVGAALLFLPAATIPSLWFKRKRGLATGVVYCGAGVGSALIALVLERLIGSLGLETALKILGILAWAICLPASWFIKAPPGHQGASSRVQWRLFQSLKFVLMFLMGAVASLPLFVPPFLLPLYVSSVGLSKQTGAAILACWNLASAVGRIGMGFGADAVFGPVNSMLLSLTVLGLTAMALWPFASSLGLLIFFSILNGISSGGFFSLMPVVVGAVFGDGELAVIMSMLVSSWTFGYFLVSGYHAANGGTGVGLFLSLVYVNGRQGAPIAGYVLEAYGGAEGGAEAYRPAFIYAGALTLASAGLILAVRLMINRKIVARV